MKFENLSKATVLLRDRAAIDTDIDRATRSLGVTFGGQYQDEEVLNVVRPYILALLLRKRDAVDAELRALGVEF